MIFPNDDRSGLPPLQTGRILRQPDFPWQIFHLHFFSQRIGLFLFLSDTNRLRLFHVDQCPEGIGNRKLLALFRIHKKIPVAEISPQVIGDRSDSDSLPQCRKAADLNLPGVENPGLMLLRKISHPAARILRLKGGAILKIIQESLHLQMSVSIDFAVSDSGCKKIHIDQTALSTSVW